VARKFKFCISCRRTITDTEFRRGLYVETRRGMLCATCARRLDEEPVRPAPAAPPAEPLPTQTAAPAGKPPAPGEAVGKAAAERLENIERQLEGIQRILLFDRSSTWSVMAGVAQLLAVGMLVVAAFRWLDDPVTVLLVAVIFQIMALTFFVKGRM